MNPLVDPFRRAPAVVDRARAGASAVFDSADTLPAAVEDIARAAAFWAGVLLPCIHLPLLLVAGLTASTTPLLVALWTLHAAVLVVGARHEPGQRDRDDATTAPADD